MESQSPSSSPSSSPSLRDRLRLIDKSQQQSQTPPAALAPAGLQHLLGGEIIENEAGRFFARRQRLQLELCHGPRRLADALQLTPAELTALDPRLDELTMEGALYLDTETTGLAGGSGTYAFMVGLAFFEQGALVIEQLIMREHCEEKAMLTHLRSRLRKSTGLITFNGKSFDAQLLDTRFCLNRIPPPLCDMAHLDLLPLARRLWSRALPDCRLETLERELLGLPRKDDIPGWMIPQVYFRYLQRQDARGLALVAEHNRRDMLAMVGLVAGLGGYLRQPTSLEHRFRRDLTVHEDFALGRYHFRTRTGDIAAALLQRVLDQDAPKEIWLGAATLLARLHCRNGQREQACQLWRAILQRQPLHDGALEGLAMFFEHRQRDLEQALGLVHQALDIPHLTRGRRSRWQRRKERLLRRLTDSA